MLRTNADSTHSKSHNNLVKPRDSTSLDATNSKVNRPN